MAEGGPITPGRAPTQADVGPQERRRKNSPASPPG